ncbi:MAG: DUF4296 domain-containing protein [Bacteroidaceae bacterium]|nr:DUF4296 domain-containing protein [Bacteroidaceae bacterium]
MEQKGMTGAMKHRTFLYLFPLLLLASCSVEVPSDIISERKMERILYDYHMAQGMAEAKGGDMEKNRYLYVQKVFEKYHVTEAEFDSSMVWYMGHMSYLEDIYKHIEARMERESNKAGLNIPEEDLYRQYTAEGDTANIWQGRDMLFLHGNREENLYSLVIPADTAFHRGDYFKFRCTNRFISQDGQREAYVLMQVKYDNDSVVAATTMLNGDYDVTLDIPKNKVTRDADIKSITCTFYYSFNEEKEEAFRLWAINKPVLLRYHVAPEDTINVEPVDTIAAETREQEQEQSRGERLSPVEFRSSQQVEHKINVVEKRKVFLPSKKR